MKINIHTFMGKPVLLAVSIEKIFSRGSFGARSAVGSSGKSDLSLLNIHGFSC